MKNRGIALGFVLSTALVPTMAWAHATPIEYQPEASSIQETAPSEIRIIFSERPEPVATSIHVFGPSGKKLEEGSVQIDPANEYAAYVPIKAAGTGTYTVSWSVVSADDGHYTTGAYAFGVGSASTIIDTSSFTIEHTSDAYNGLATWLSLLGHALVIGACAVWLLGTHRRNIFWISLLGGLAILIGESWLYALLGNTVPEGISAYATTAGFYALARMISGIGIMMISFYGFKKPKYSIMGLVFFAVLFAILRSRVSHAAASAEWPMFSVFINIIHLLSKDLWIGSVIVCAILVKNISEKNLSKLVAVGLAMGSATGAYIVWLHLKSFDALHVSQWGGRTVTLTAFAVVLLAMRLAQEFLLRNNVTQKSLWRIGEAVTGIFILLSSAFALITTPPVEAPGFWSQSQENQNISITLAEHPTEYDRLELIFSDQTVSNVVITAMDADRNIGPLEVPTQKIFAGGYALPKNVLSGGSWVISVVGSRDNAYDLTATFQLPISATDTQMEKGHRSTAFTLLFVLVAVAGIAAGIYLYKRANNAAVIELHILTLQERLTMGVVVSVALLYMGYHFAHQPLNAFRGICEQAGNMWHDNVPTRDGKPTSSIAVPGCMVGMGKAQRHFADVRAYMYYSRPAQALAEISMSPLQPKAGETTNLQFAIRDAQGNAVQDLVAEHDKLLHVIIIGQDGTTFQHVHPDDSVPQNTSDFTVPVVFPKAGRYVVAVDYTVRSHTFGQQFYVTVTGENVMPLEHAQPTRIFQSGSYTVTLDGPSHITANQEAKLSFRVQKDGQDLLDLQPYLAASMHFAILSEDLRKVAHIHGELPRTWLESLIHPHVKGRQMHMPVPNTFGPLINTYITFAEPGTYIIFGQFQHEGKIQTVRWVVTAN